jgi:pimeloyl-ACP methyl ester carboxylesterase
MLKAEGLEYEANGDGAAVLLIHGALIADTFLPLMRGPDRRTEVAKTLPGGPEQAEKDAATFFEVEVPAFEKWNLTFDSDRASRISQPVLFVIGSESIPRLEAAKQHFQSLIPHTKEVVVPGVDHSMLTRDPKLVAAPIADFLSRQPL